MERHLLSAPRSSLHTNQGVSRRCSCLIELSQSFGVFWNVKEWGKYLGWSVGPHTPRKLLLCPELWLPDIARQDPGQHKALKEFRQTKLAHSYWAALLELRPQLSNAHTTPACNPAKMKLSRGRKTTKKIHSFCQTNAKCIKCKYPQHSHLTLRASFPSVTYQAAWRSL